MHFSWLPLFVSKGPRARLPKQERDAGDDRRSNLALYADAPARREKPARIDAEVSGDAARDPAQHQSCRVVVVAVVVVNARFASRVARAAKNGAEPDASEQKIVEVGR